MYKFSKKLKHFFEPVFRHLVNLLRSNQLLIRRFLAFVADFLILSLASLLIAYIIFSFDLNIIPPFSTPFVFTSYFLLSRMASKKGSLGMKILNIEFDFGTNKHHRLRLFQRILLIISIFYLPQLIPFSIDYLTKPNFNQMKIGFASISIVLSILVYNTVLIFLSNGKSSLFDRLSGCSMSLSTSPKNLESSIPSLTKKQMGGLILLSAFGVYCSIFIYWKIDIGKLFSDENFQSLNINPIDKVGLAKPFQQYTVRDYPIVSYIKIRGNYLIPYESFPTHNMLEVILFIPKSKFHDKDLHQRIAINTETARLNYNSIYQQNLFQSRITLRRFGSFGPFFLQSDYNYILGRNADDELFIVGDISATKKEEIRSDIFSNIQPEFSTVDTLHNQITYPGFYDMKPEFSLYFSINTSTLNQGLVFDYVKEDYLRFY